MGAFAGEKYAQLIFKRLQKLFYLDTVELSVSYLIPQNFSRYFDEFKSINHPIRVVKYAEDKNSIVKFQISFLNLSISLKRKSVELNPI